jgi:hypothetical protein
MLDFIKVTVPVYHEYSILVSHMLSSGLFPGVCSLNPNVLGHTVPSSYLPAYEDGTQCSETLAFKLQTPGNNPEESIQHSKHDESLK